MARTYGKAQDLIDFTRASSGTALRRVKYTEKVVNGTFDTDTTGWSVSSNLTASSVSGEAVISCSADFGYFSQNLGLEVGKIYKVYLDVSAVSGTVLVRNGTTAESPADNYKTINSTGSVELTIVPANTGSWFILVFGSGESITIDNVSVKEVTFDTSDGDLILFNHPNNIPRIEYDANGNLLGLLVEEARTNLIDDSEALDGWTGEGDATTDVTAPDGNQTATKIGDDAVGGVGTVKAYKTVTVSTSTEYTFSAFCKKGQLNWSALGLVNFTTPVNGRVWFDLENGVVGVEDAGLTGTIKAFPDGWYRCSVTFTTDAADTSGNLYVYASEGNNRFVDTARDGTSDIYAWGAQLEAGAFPTSYIPTSGSTATRSADVASLSTSAFGYNQSAGTMVVEARNSENCDVLALIDDGSTNNRIRLYESGSNVVGLVSVNSTNVAVMVTSQSVSVDSLKSAIAAKKDDFAVVANGGSVFPDTAGDMPSNLTSLKVATPETGGAIGAVHIKSIKYYPRRLTNAQLQELTS